LTVTSCTWEKVSGPSPVVFTPEKSCSPVISASVDGNYQVKVTVKDSAANTSSRLIDFIWNGPKPPLHAAAGGSFTDTDLDANQLGGSLLITKATDESDVTSYVVYW